jgi:hypothetical protein
MSGQQRRVGRNRVLPILSAMVLALLLAPAAAQEAPAPAEQSEPRGRMVEGIDMLGEGMRLLLEGLQDETAPLMQELLDQAVPALGAAREGLGRLVAGLEAIGVGLADLAGYDAPVLLPNGDILIRRRPPAVPAVPPAENDAAGAREL